MNRVYLHIFRLPHSLRAPLFLLKSSPLSRRPHLVTSSLHTHKLSPFYYSLSTCYICSDSPPTPPPQPPSSSTAITNHTLTADEAEDIVIPDPPSNCCMSGCANCVWITYAQDLATIYGDREEAAEKVMNAIDDPSLKIFLHLELKGLLEESEVDDH